MKKLGMRLKSISETKALGDALLQAGFLVLLEKWESDDETPTEYDIFICEDIKELHRVELPFTQCGNKINLSIYEDSLEEANYSIMKARNPHFNKLVSLHRNAVATAKGE